jgi:hypothetical protein
MKKNIIFLLITLFFFGCRTYDFGVTNQLKDFADDIFEHPDNLWNIKKYYSEFYNEDFISTRLSDTNNTKKVIKFINDNKNKYYKMCGTGFDSNSLNWYKRFIKNKSITLDNLFGFSYEFGNKGIGFEFIHINNKYFILDIHYVASPTL